LIEAEETINEYVELYLGVLPDEVEFARKILDFNPYGYQEEFLRDRSRRIVACCGRQVGKTTLTAIKALHFALSHDRTVTLIVSAGLRQSINLFDKIADLIDTALSAQAMLRYKTRRKIEFVNGSRIIALPCGRDGSTLRGFTADMVILDEANFIPPMVINSVIRPTTITRPEARTIMLSTPWTKDHPFYEALTKEEQEFKTYTWPSSMNPSISNESLELERKTIGEFNFDREYNAQFLDDQASFFPSNLVLACTDDYELNPDLAAGTKYKGDFHIGIDFGKKSDHTVIAIIQRMTEEELRLVYLKEFELGTPYMTVIGIVKMLDKAYEFTFGYLDQTGVGESPCELIREDVARIAGMKLTLQSKEDILGGLRLAMERGDVTLPREQQRLLTQITSQRYELTISGNLKFSHPTGANDDQLWALALSIHSALTHPRIPNIVIGVKGQE
jgi:phage FluMu gp28-like protein